MYLLTNDYLFSFSSYGRFYVGSIHGPDTAPFSAYELLAYTNVVIDKLK